ncbi:MAG: serine/threonine protein kinase [Candidatus Adiutrix sp.]|jgi:serine/threonine protein kinase|nr:serine/threonine protein kinase [Candidatus Adiutrix sp.]
MSSATSIAQAKWAQVTSCPVCLARYYLNRANIGHRTVCQKCGAYFHLLPQSSEPATQIISFSDLGREDMSLVGRLWLDLRPGLIVSRRYKVIRFLGRGGLSQIFQALDIEEDRHLALKLPLPATLDRLPPQVFLQEARAWLKPARHPNLVTCEGVMTIMRQPVIFMEYITGLNLDRLMDEGNGQLYQGRPGSIVARLLDTFIQAARGLKYAHQLGLNHLDIKPRNILVERGGRVLIGDYGPLNQVDPAAGAKTKAQASDETSLETTRLVGTPQYFSPEVALGRPGAGVGADLWALTLSALECFLGRRPWEMGSMAGRALEHYLAEFQPRVMVPPPLADFFRQALAEKPENRQPSAAELESDLTSVYKRITKRPYLRPEAVMEPERPERMKMKAVALAELARLEEQLKERENG